MTIDNFIPLVEELLELDKGALKGNEPLDSLEDWDSLAIIGFLAMTDRHFGVAVEPESVMSCKTLDQLKSLVEKSL
ncbi:MAG: acyl carrier protein [Candidatus Nitrohelix vancouverensis]|uniref:Acyl carrier protein n=1 Tax=Candidatus Nitrohelix vancouverensis TaxID=2705534 RepID=A0A7T0G286_9BACT|nr:MAG: acyl carrier protein [Candidatus Nitrohelix vancouverensis]